MTYEARGRGEPRNEFSIILDTNEPANNELTVTATVLFRKKHAPDPPRVVIFYVNDSEISRAETDQEGRVATLITLPGPGSYRAIAQLEGMPGVRASRLITIKEPPQKENPKATKVAVRVIGKRGEQKLFIYAVADNGTFVPGTKVLILNGDQPSTITTDENGMFIYPTSFAGRRVFRVRIGENDPNNKQRSWRGVLIGRK